MNRSYGPYYTLAEARNLLKVQHSDLKYLIDGGKIKPVVYTKPRSFLLFRLDENDNWIGYGSCVYRGHYSLHWNYVDKLMDGEPIRIGKGWGKLLDANGIEEIRLGCPFKSSHIGREFHSWVNVPTKIDEQFSSCATPLPNEYLPLFAAIDNLIEANSDFKKGGKTLKMPSLQPVEKLSLNFNVNSEFRPEDLRIPSSEIDAFLQPKSEQKNGPSTPEGVKPVSTPPRFGVRENQLHTLIAKILVQKPGISPLDVWKLIEQDCNSDSPAYDEDAILTNVTVTEINWSSRHGRTQVMSWDSFQPLISKLKKKIAEIR